ncbi:hypothetical protein [Hyalangium minutum]|uniref:Uncharacterized protein n=1 Tax=Hyalangium minutum TaxID=394096 RepID=A0A085WN74_9BACT|nr:hypothetical protein [Hyalangium minutum]KFE69137.1 hypothetical protein DB31_7039 [Hyalangium minutum]
MLPLSSRPPRGYILLAVMLLLAALVLLVALAQQRAGDEGLTANRERSEAQARALAEAGLERTRAYLGELLARDVDLDRALDPGLDTDCLTLPALGGVTWDDHLPPFADSQPVTVSSSGRDYLRVLADEGAEGAYFVRIDDNDDDAQDSMLLSPATSNNPIGNCLEGPVLGPLRDNPVRDRDGMVWVTVIGVHPGTSLEGNDARVTLRVLVGPGEPAGIIAGGTVRMSGAAHVCGPFGDVVATGSVEGGCLCGAACSSGPFWNACVQGEACIAQAGGSMCSATSGRGPGTEVCEAGVSVPPPPRVSAWDVTNAPLDCTGAPCLPFYYLRLDEGAAQARLYGWSYSACHSPRSAPRVCSPADCPTCWVLLDANTQNEPMGISLSHADPGLRNPSPSVTIPGARAPRVWLADGSGGFRSGSGSCDAGDTALYPGTTGFGRRDVRNVWFEYFPESAATPLPRGVWFVEGNVRFRSAGTPSCAALQADPTYSASIIATGSIVHEAGLISLRPASPKGVVLLAGRDLVMRGAQSRVLTCGTSAAVMVHEQVVMGGDSHVEAQLVAENASTCDAEVVGEAVQMSGSATVAVPQFPPVPAGPPLRVRLQSESTH